VFLKTSLILAILSLAPLTASLSQAESFSLDKSEIRAQLMPLEFATLSASMSGELKSFDVREGQWVKKGQVKGVKRMFELEATGEIELENARLELKRTTAEKHYLQAVVDKCFIKAPYSGTIGEKFVHANEFVELGKPLLEIQNTQKLVIEFIAPSTWLSWLKPNYPFQIFVVDTNKTYSGIINSLSAKVDAMSQSVKVFASLNQNSSELLPGMSGYIKIQAPQTLQ
jgi:membrane fusion protein (multidrug efflux system)